MPEETNPSVPPVEVPPVVNPETKKERKTPDPVSTLIGKWNEDRTVFTVITRLEAATDKQKTDAIKALPFGTYTVLTTRETVKTLKEVTRVSIA
jgi:hypothetical protein